MRGLVKIIPVILAEGVLLGGAFWTGGKFLRKEQNCLNQNRLNPQNNTYNKEISYYYSVEYPSNFFITTKTFRRFMVAENRWKGESVNFPEAGIQIYANVLPEGMSLREWLEGVSDPEPAVGREKPLKSCKRFFATLRQRIKSEDSDLPSQNEDRCWFLGISHIKETTVRNLPAIQFWSEAGIGGSILYYHTIIAYKGKFGNYLFDIFYKSTGLSDEKDKTREAYRSFLRTFRIRSDNPF